MVQWILAYHHFIILGLVILGPLMLFLRGFYRDYKRKREIQSYKWDRFVYVGTMLYVSLTMLIIGIILGGRVVPFP